MQILSDPVFGWLTEERVKNVAADNAVSYCKVKEKEWRVISQQERRRGDKGRDMTVLGDRRYQGLTHATVLLRLRRPCSAISFNYSTAVVK